MQHLPDNEIYSVCLKLSQPQSNLEPFVQMIVCLCAAVQEGVDSTRSQHLFTSTGAGSTQHLS